MAEQEKTFDESLNELEKIVEKLEQGDVPLEEALDKFQEGITLSRELKKTLQEAEETLAKVVTENGDEEIFEESE
jgi:exodeoxyribonuclease VII small subunit